jgi:hypothetical protein
LQSGVAAIAAGGAVWIVGNTRQIESYRICGIENLPGEFQLILFGDLEDFGNAGVDAEVSITSLEIALHTSGTETSNEQLGR